MGINRLLESPKLIEDAMATLQLLIATCRAAPTQENDQQIGEAFARMAKECGCMAATYLFRAQWNYKTPEWFDHRLHTLDPEHWFNDYWTASADNVCRVLPLGGRVLDLCSGDGFYGYWFYRYRGSVVCVEKNREAWDHARRLHSHPDITYLLWDVLYYEPPAGDFDVVVIRGAIEHFSREEQQELFLKAYRALKPGGYFCGDTPAMRKTEVAMNAVHECEWRDEAEMLRALSANPATLWTIETWSLESHDRTTLFWRCRKP